MLSLLIDFESTGLDTSKDRIIEIGAQVVDEDWEVQASLSRLIKDPNIKLTPEIVKITGITDEELSLNGIPLAEAARELAQIGAFCTSVIAYNRTFDEMLFKTEMARYQMMQAPGIKEICNQTWLCAMTDIEANYDFKCWKLSHLALDHGLAVDPRTLHRAINDVDLMRRMLKELNAHPDDLRRFQNTPWVFIRALIPKPWEDQGKGRDEAKKLGYGWEMARGTTGPKFEGAWVKRVKETRYEEEVKMAPFKVRRMEAV